MEKKESRKGKDIKNQTFDNKNSNFFYSDKKTQDKSLPWWVEFLFVQIGLPDKWLIKILKRKKLTKEFIKNEKRTIFKLFLYLAFIAYFYPLIKYNKTKLYCQTTAKIYIKENKNLSNINEKQLNMLSTNFCNGGEEIYELENVKK